MAHLRLRRWPILHSSRAGLGISSQLPLPSQSDGRDFLSVSIAHDHISSILDDGEKTIDASDAASTQFAADVECSDLQIPRRSSQSHRTNKAHASPLDRRLGKSSHAHGKRPDVTQNTWGRLY